MESRRNGPQLSSRHDDDDDDKLEQIRDIESI